MPEPIKKPHTDGDYEKVLLTAASNSFAEDSVPWEEAFPDITPDKAPGICLQGARGKEGVTQKQLSKMTGIPVRQISAMENGRMVIGKEKAKIFGKVLNVGYRVFL